MAPIAREYDDLFRAADADWPASQLYHEQSKLAPAKGLAFRERLAEYASDLDAIRASTRAVKEHPGIPRIPLEDQSKLWRGARLADALRRRRTRRDNGPRSPLTLTEWGSLLLRSGGVTGESRHPDCDDVVQPLRAWPSGGGLFPIEAYIVSFAGELTTGNYYFHPQERALVQLSNPPLAEAWREIVYAEGLWEGVVGMIVLTAVFARTQTKYGERGYRFVLLDAGHFGQNLLLTAEDLRIDLIPIGGFDDNGVAAAFGLDSRQEAPVHLFLVRGRRH
ncbi:MAG: SagB/ThcOx family dehydrogenase [Pirellulaceae bacterium]|jgi:SagB-type dehydrogenase family enzyme|nr:SagB/ThcOx family dehydrogenase [Pirellulaceae bacterium]MDP7015481.1 SagB/ThcOx family dehydrogenase [Pirellulaceae bacterium]